MKAANSQASTESSAFFYREIRRGHRPPTFGSSPLSAQRSKVLPLSPRSFIRRLSFHNVYVSEVAIVHSLHARLTGTGVFCTCMLHKAAASQKSLQSLHARLTGTEYYFAHVCCISRRQGKTITTVVYQQERGSTTLGEDICLSSRHSLYSHDFSLVSIDQSLTYIGATIGKERRTWEVMGNNQPQTREGV